MRGSAGITAFILDMRTPGVTTRPLREITGTTDFNEVFLDEVAVPVANMIGAPGEGWRVAGASLAQERGGVGAGGSGGAIARLLKVARESARHGRPAIDDAAVRQDIGSFVARSRIQRYLGYAVSTKAAAGTITPSDAPTTKIWFSELNLEMSDYAMMLQGPRGALVEGDALAFDDGHWQDSFLYAAGVDDRGRLERDHAQSDRRARPWLAAGAPAVVGPRLPFTPRGTRGLSCSGCSAAA